MLSIFIILLLVQNVKNEGCMSAESSTIAPCGSYGFRCVDELTYQICGTIDSEGNVEQPELTRECFKGLVCDEENPAYCSPIDENLEAAKNDIHISRREELFDNNGEEITSCFKEIEITTEMQNIEDVQDTTISFLQQQYVCPGYGQYADTANKTLYWICDSSDNAIGYSVLHMTCGKGRIFEAKLRECVTVGTTRDVRSSTSKQKLLRICRINRKTHRFRLKRGDCENYYLCYNHNQDIMKMQCPRYYQFSDKYSRCMPENLVDCDAQNNADEIDEAGDYYYVD